MSTLLISHSDCEKHIMHPRHPESPARLAAIMDQVEAVDWGGRLQHQDAREIDPALFAGVHPAHYIQSLVDLAPGTGLAAVDADTALNPYSLRAARLAAGAAVTAVEQVMDGSAENAFCAVRPPGHHAESAIAMGFCLFNNIALAAERALSLGAERVAIVDFDVHHGNGTVDIFLDRDEVMVCSSFQYPFYPGRYDQVEAGNIVLTPLAEGTASAVFRQSIERDWLPALRRHKPDLILVSAGFDAHREDPLGGLLLEDTDYLWVTQLLRDCATELCGGRIVSCLEGGYKLQALARSVGEHLTGLSS